MNWYKGMNPLSLFRHQPNQQPSQRPSSGTSNVLEDDPEIDYEKERQDILNSSDDDNIKRLKLQRLNRARMKEQLYRSRNRF